MKTKTKKNIAERGLPRTYKGLTARFMPRPLHDEVDYQNAIEAVEELAGFDLNSDQEDYLDAVTTFIEKYEEEHHEILSSESSEPLDVLHYLLEENKMSESDLGRLLGDRSLGHCIMKGERMLSKKHIRILSERFSVSPELFFK